MLNKLGTIENYQEKFTRKIGCFLPNINVQIKTDNLKKKKKKSIFCIIIERF